MSEILSVLAVYLLELFISYYFFSQVSNRKKTPLFCFAIGLITFGLGATVYLLFSTIWLNLVCFLIINMVFAFCCFNVNLKQSIFLSIILDIMSTCTEYITIFIISIVLNRDVIANSHDVSQYLLNVVISKTIYFFCCLLLIKFIKTKDTSTPIPKTYYFYPIVVIVVLLFLWSINSDFDLSQTYKYIISIISFSLLLSTILIFVSYRRSVDKETKLLQLESELTKLENDKTYYQILEQQNENLAIYAHDTQKHLAAIKELSSNEEIDKYLTQMQLELKKYSQASHSGNHFLDVIINKYITECELKEIKFTYDVRLSNLLGIEMYDLVAILGNVLDNAVEAAEKSQGKYIDFFTDHRNTYYIVVIKNSCDKKPISDNLILKTTKNNKRFHGFGLKSLRNTLKKYNGDYTWEYDEHNREFITTIMILKNR